MTVSNAYPQPAAFGATPGRPSATFDFPAEPWRSGPTRGIASASASNLPAVVPGMHADARPGAIPPARPRSPAGQTSSRCS